MDNEFAKEKMKNQYFTSQVLGNTPIPDPTLPQQYATAPAEQSGPPAKCTEIRYYNKYFRLTSDQFMERVKCALMPWKRDFFSLIKENPDLYGPWWICITLVIMLAISGNLYRYLAMANPSLYQYNFQFIPTAFFSVLTYQSLIPLVLFLLFKSFKCPLSYVETVCAIGYSMLTLILAIGVCSIPNGMLQWVSLGIACANSTLFLSNNYSGYLQKVQLQNNRYLVIGIVLLSQVGLLFVVKMYFFELVYTEQQINQQVNVQKHS